MPKSTANLSLTTYDSTTDKDNLSKLWFDETFGYEDSNMTKIDDAYGELKKSVPTNTGEGATGDWDINITGTAQTAIHDGSGNDINSTYIKEITSNSGTLNIKKGDNSTSSIDVSSPAGYVLSKEAYFSWYSSSIYQSWYHIGDIKNTSDNDFVKININISSTGSSMAHSKTLYLRILDTVQTSTTLLDTAYSFSLESTPYSEGDSNAILVPTSGGNGSSSAEVWVKGPNYLAKVLVTVETSKKEIFDFVLTQANYATSSEFQISPTKIIYTISSDTYGSTSSKGIVQAGSGINASDGVISLAPATSNTIGGIMVGDGLSYDSNTGKVSMPNASRNTKGGIIIGDNLTISSYGYLSLTSSNITNALGYKPSNTIISYGTSDLTPGSSYLASGSLYVMYE